MVRLVVATLLAATAINCAYIARAFAQNPDPSWMLDRRYGPPPDTSVGRCVRMGYRGRDLDRCVIALENIEVMRRPRAPAYVPSPAWSCDTITMDSNFSFTDCY